MQPHTTRTALAATLLATLTLTSCHLPNLANEEAAAPTELPTDTATALAGLTIAPEDNPGGYDRDNWPHWSTKNGCDTREHVLIAQGRHVTTDNDCDITSGTWTSVYDGRTVTDPGELDIDHVVPLGEAAVSGTTNWSKDQRETYANDPAVLLAVTAHSNRAKSDQDPAEWLPTRHRCHYVTHWITVKTRYDMTADAAEADALAAVVATCGGDR